MRRRSNPGLAALSLALAFETACGKRADPLAPYLKTPQPPTGFDISQIGDEIEIRITAPRTTTENRPLPVIQLEWLHAPATGDFGKVSSPLLREDAAPSEIRTKRFPRPAADTRFSVRAWSGKTHSTAGAPFLFKPAPVPLQPTDIQATNIATGVELRWTNPPGAEPWPTPSPSPSPSPSPATATAGAAGPVEPKPESTPSPTPKAGGSPDLPAPPTERPPGPTPLGSARPAASPGPLPTPVVSPTPPTGIRVFRTDGTPRLLRGPIQDASWTDVLPKLGEKPCYSLRYATSLKPLVESAPTEPVCVEIKDLVPPEAPARLVGDIGATFVELSWTASTSTDVSFYRIYRSIDAGARTVAIETQGLVLRIHDPNMTRGPRVYEVVAVDKGGNESAPGPPLKIVIP